MQYINSKDYKVQSDFNDKIMFVFSNNVNQFVLFVIKIYKTANHYRQYLNRAVTIHVNNLFYLK